RLAVLAPEISERPAAVREGAERYGVAGTGGLRDQWIGRREKVDRQAGAIGHAVAGAGNPHRVIARAGGSDSGQGQRSVGLNRERRANVAPLISERPGALGGGAEGDKIGRAAGR